MKCCKREIYSNHTTHFNNKTSSSGSKRLQNSISKLSCRWWWQWTGKHSIPSSRHRPPPPPPLPPPHPMRALTGSSFEPELKKEIPLSEFAVGYILLLDQNSCVPPSTPSRVHSDWIEIIETPCFILSCRMSHLVWFSDKWEWIH